MMDWFIKKHHVDRIAVYVTCVLVILAIALPAGSVVSAAPASPFIGYWQAVDVDGSDIRLSIGGRPAGPFQITWTESYIGFCDREAGIMRGTGWLNLDDPNILEADLFLVCFTTGNTYNFHTTFVYHPDTGMLRNTDEAGFVQVFYRPGRPVPWGWRQVIGHTDENWVEGWGYEEGTVVRLAIFDDQNHLIFLQDAIASYPEWSPEVAWVAYSLDFDLKAGDQLWMSDGLIVKGLRLTNLEITGMDMETEMVFGIAEPGSEVIIEYPPDQYFSVMTGDDGNWEAYVAGLVPGVAGLASQQDEDFDLTRVVFFQQAPIMMAFPVVDQIFGYGWPVGSEVTLKINGEEIQTVTVGPAPWDENDIMAFFDFGTQYDLVTDDVVVLSGSGMERSHTVRDLTFQGLNIATDRVWGEAVVKPDEVIYAWVHGYDASQLEVPVVAGVWEADFASVGFDLQEAMCGRVEIRVDGNATSVDWCVPDFSLRVNYGHDWVESFFEAGHTVHVTVTDADGVIKAEANVVTEPKDYMDWAPGFQTRPEDWFPAQPDIQAYDWVYAAVDNGQTEAVQLGDIQAEVRFDLDNIMGTINVPWLEALVQVECLDWGSGGPSQNKDAGWITPDGLAEFACAWNPVTEWDVQPWQDIGVGYVTPEGNWVANAFRDQRWMAMWTADLPPGFWFEGVYNYRFFWNFTIPEPGGMNDEPPVRTLVSAFELDGSPTPLYERYALVQFWESMQQFAWTGSGCETIPAINPLQETRFVWGWVNDYSMTEEEALAHFNSFTVTTEWWNDWTGGMIPLTMRDLQHYTGPDSRMEYRCSLTEHP